MKNLICSGLVVLAALSVHANAAPSVASIRVRGIDFPKQIEVNSSTLPLQGLGVRKVTFLVFPFYAYVAAFYSKQPLTSDNQSFRFDITYLREFSVSQTQEAWTKQFEHSAELNYEGRADHLQRLSTCFGKIEEGTVHRFDVQGSQVVISEISQGKSKPCTEINDDRFLKSFISIWIGKNPPTEELKEGLTLGAGKLSERSSL